MKLGFHHSVWPHPGIDPLILSKWVVPVSGRSEFALMKTRWSFCSHKHGIECLGSWNPHLVFTPSGYVSPSSGINDNRCSEVSIKARPFPIGYLPSEAGSVLGLTASEVEKLLCRRWSGLEFHIQFNLWRCYKVKNRRFKEILCYWQVYTAGKVNLVMKETSTRSLKVSSKGIHEL